MTVRTATRAALVAGLAATALAGAAAPAVAAGGGDALGHPTSRAHALFVDEAEGIVVDLTVAEVAGRGTTVTLGLFAEGWACTATGQPATADVVRLKSARLAGTFDYTCAVAGGGQGVAPVSPDGTVVVDLTWSGVGAATRQPLYDCAVGRYVARDAVVSGSVSVTGDLAAAPTANAASLARESTVCPPGRLR